MKSIPLQIAALTVALCAQLQPAARPEFEVASVKPNTSESLRSSTRLTPGQALLENASLRKCIALAYDVSEDREEAISGPDWLRSERYDIAAKFAPGTSLEDVRAMLQNLLADRFQLKLHRESKQRTIYALVTRKNGANLVESAPGAKGLVSMSAGRLTATAVPMNALADRLSGSVFDLGRPVVDRTGLTGLYDFTLEWTPDSVQGGDASGPSLFTAVEEQLGLKLEAQKDAVEVLVVDSMERKPTAN